MADILDEVLSDKHEERKVFYLKKALPIVGIITLLVIIIMVVNNIRVSTKEKYNIEMGDTLVKSLENAQTDQKVAIEGIEYLMDNAENHAKDAAALQMIAMNIARSDAGGTLSVIQKVIDGKNYLPITQNYAKLMWISIILDSTDSIQEENAKQMEKYFKDFESEDVPFYGSANLLKALYYQKTDKAKALSIAEKIVSSKKVAPTLQDEARAIIANITVNNN